MTDPSRFTLESETPKTPESRFTLEDDTTAPQAPAPLDFTKGKGGTYKMLSPERELKDIPYENVMKASDAGWKVHPSERERYASDRRQDVLKTQPKISEDEYLKQMKLPEALPEKPGQWSRVEGAVQKYTEPTTVFPGVVPTLHSPETGEFGLNFTKRVGRVLFGIPDFGAQAFSALKDSLSADPQKAKDGEDRLAAMHPGAQIYNRLQELREDWNKDPKLAAPTWEATSRACGWQAK